MIICGCAQAERNCELNCDKYKGKKVYPGIVGVKQWPNKRKLAMQRILNYAKSLDWQDKED